MNDRLKWRMWSTHAGRYFDENNDAMLENVFECMKQQICYDCQNPVLRKIYDRIAYNHIADGMVFEQCTGLKDKNGKLIYEGNIVKDDIGLVAPVCFDEVNAMFYIDRYIGVYNYPFAYFYHYDSETELEVIGNIHENADLLENEE